LIKAVFTYDFTVNVEISKPFPETFSPFFPPFNS